MGFGIVNLSYGLEELPAITQYSAGPDQTVICAIYVHLTATMLADEMEGHDTLWEQIKGTPVTFIGSPLNNLEVSYEQTNIKDDKTFRFWIDKGTPDALYDDITIYGTPTEVVSVGIAMGAASVVNYATISNAIQSANVFSMPAPETSLVSSAGTSVLNNPDVWVYWLTPSSPIGSLTSVDVYENSTGAFVFKQSISATSPQFYTEGNPQYTYRIDTWYNTSSNVLQSFTGYPVRLTLGDTATVTDKTASPGINGGFEMQTSVFKLSKVVLEPQESVQHAIGYGSYEFTSSTRPMSKFELRTDADTAVVGWAFNTEADVAITVTLKTRSQVGGTTQIGG